MDWNNKFRICMLIFIYHSKFHTKTCKSSNALLPAYEFTSKKYRHDYIPCCLFFHIPLVMKVLQFIYNQIPDNFEQILLLCLRLCLYLCHQFWKLLCSRAVNCRLADRRCNLLMKPFWRLFFNNKIVNLTLVEQTKTRRSGLWLRHANWVICGTDCSASVAVQFRSLNWTCHKKKTACWLYNSIAFFLCFEWKLLKSDRFVPDELIKLYECWNFESNSLLSIYCFIYSFLIFLLILTFTFIELLNNTCLTFSWANSKNSWELDG